MQHSYLILYVKLLHKDFLDSKIIGFLNQNHCILYMQCVGF